MPPVPIEYGDDCGVCFASGETPEFVYIRFGLMEACNPVIVPPCRTAPNDRPFKLTQVNGIPCQYRYDIDPWHVFWSFKVGGPPLGALQLRDWLNRIYFAAIPAQCLAEGTVIHNDIFGWVGNACVANGIAVVTWNPQATKLLADINMKKARALFMELRPIVDGKLVYKFCRLQDITNISILFEP